MKHIIEIGSHPSGLYLLDIVNKSGCFPDDLLPKDHINITRYINYLNGLNVEVDSKFTGREGLITYFRLTLYVTPNKMEDRLKLLSILYTAHANTIDSLLTMKVYDILERLLFKENPIKIFEDTTSMTLEELNEHLEEYGFQQIKGLTND